MTKTIYNEGRVVGESAYEEYVRQLKSVDPDFDVCTEREWLSAALGAGTSLILRIPKEAGSKVSSSSDLYMYQVELPYGSHIGAGNPISGSYFYGECEYDEKGWATVVTDYGSLISNTSSSNPEDDSTSITTDTVPTKDISSELELPDTTDVSDISYTTQQLRLHEYIKIVDGIVIQPGTWEETDSGNPYKDFKPDLSLNPVIRLTFYEKIINPFYILLTGFTNRSILKGSSKFDLGAVDTEHPEDGDFIGCECYPWSTKIQFTSSPIVDYLNAKNLIRGSRNLKVETYNNSPLIKITSNNLLDTTVYTRSSNISTGSSSANSYGTSPVTWTGNTSASTWYSTTNRTANIASKCNDSSVDTSGSETVECGSYNVPGFTVSNNYQDYDKNTIKNGVHGGWYDIKIDPYKMIQDLIDEIYARFSYFQTRTEQLEGDLSNSYKHLHLDTGWDDLDGDDNVYNSFSDKDNNNEKDPDGLTASLGDYTYNNIYEYIYGALKNTLSYIDNSINDTVSLINIMIGQSSGTSLTYGKDFTVSYPKYKYTPTGMRDEHYCGWACVHGDGTNSNYGLKEVGPQVYVTPVDYDNSNNITKVLVRVVTGRSPGSAYRLMWVRYGTDSNGNVTGIADATEECSITGTNAVTYRVQFAHNDWGETYKNDDDEYVAYTTSYYSRLFTLEFANESLENPRDSNKTLSLSNLNEWSISNKSDNEVGFMNVHPTTLRASWTYDLGISRTAYNGSSTDSFKFYLVSYYDGYNNQFDRYGANDISIYGVSMDVQFYLTK